MVTRFSTGREERAINAIDEREELIAWFHLIFRESALKRPYFGTNVYVIRSQNLLINQ